MRAPVILHYHLFKNAGTSVDQVLATNFGARWREHDTDDPGGSIFVDEVEAILDADPRLAALSSHQIRPPLPARPVVPIVFLRHPIDRIRSIYRFDRRRGAVTPAAVIANRHAKFADYLRAMFVERPHVVVDAQTWLLSDGWDRHTRRRLRIGPDGHYERARSFLDDLPVVGLVEHYEESWRRLRPIIAEYHSDFAVHVERSHNVDGEREATIDERLASIRADLGDKLYTEVLERNHRDLQLYDWVLGKYESTTQS